MHEHVTSPAAAGAVAHGQSARRIHCGCNLRSPDRGHAQAAPGPSSDRRTWLGEAVESWPMLIAYGCLVAALSWHRLHDAGVRDGASLLRFLHPVSHAVQAGPSPGGRGRELDAYRKAGNERAG